MRIGVDATCWQNARGYGRHARSLLGALLALDRENRYIFFLDSTEHVESLPPNAEPRVVRTSAPTAVAASAHGRRSARDLWRMSRAMSDADLDLLVFPTIYSYVPVFSRAKKVVLIHDVIAETYPHLTLPRLTARLFWNAKVTLGRRQADAVVTVSEYSRQGIQARFKVAPERLFVVGEANDPVFRVLEGPLPTPRLADHGISQGLRTIVYVGGFSPHKNLETLIQVFGTLVIQHDLRDVRLVLVGEYRNEVFHSYFGRIREQVAALGLSDRVIFTGFLPDEELVVLLNLATVLVLPSLMEGFGLPAVEAAACGCPVIATTASPLPTLLGEGGLYVDPTKPDDLLAALRAVLESEPLRRRMGAAGLAAARKLTWDAAARDMLDVLRKVGST